MMMIYLLVVLWASVAPSLARPQAVRIDTELQSSLDTRWDEDRPLDTATNDRQIKMTEIAKSFRKSKNLHRAMMEVLKTLSEEELRVLEQVLAGGEEPQGDMPLEVEDLVEDGPQELVGADEVDEMAGYRGELLVLDSVNSSTATSYNSSEPGEEPLFPQLQKINREKLKEMRLETIKNQIMNILWPVGTPPSLSSNMSTPSQPGQDLLRAIAEKMNPQHTFPGDVYTEKIQSFYPSCEIPRNTDAELWNDSSAMNLLFDLSYPTTLQGTQVNIVAAKLRLHKLSQGNVSTSLETCPPSDSEEPPSEEDSVKNQFSTNSFGEDKMIRVSIYWYTRSLKKHRVKRKLLDSQMLTVFGESWTEWNIRGAVKAWRDSGRNFGLAVEVEDEDGALLQTNKYFAPMNCSQEASTSRPIPGFLVARALATNNTNHTFGQTLHLDTFLFPMIDLCTIEFPESERPDTVYYRKVNENTVTDQRKPDIKTTRKEQNTTSTSTDSSTAEKHRLRHHSHKHMDGTHNAPPHRHLETVSRDDGDSIEEITWADDLDGHQLRKQIIVQKVIMKSHSNAQDNER